MNRPLRRVAVACLLLFALLILSANWVQVVKAEAYRDDPRNSRVLLRTYERERGAIAVVRADGSGRTAIAESSRTDGPLTWLREYPGGPSYAHVTGYYSLVYGRTSIERSEDEVLSGEDDRFFVRRLSDSVTGREPQGGNIITTIDPQAQQAAYEALGDNRGAVVALDPRTGAVLAMVSRPSFDPARLSSFDPAEIRRYYAQLNEDPADPLLNRTISRTYPPGSTFKVVTAAAALSTGDVPARHEDPLAARADLPQSTARLRNFGGESCGGDTTTLANALRISCNTAFGALGLRLGADRLREQAQAFGFGDDSLRVPTRVATSVFPDEIDAPQTATSAIGQFEVRVTPLQMAMVAAGVANGGEVMKPVPRARGAGARPLAPRPGRSRGALACRRRGRRRAAHDDDGARRRRRHRGPGADRRRPRRRQDRHRAARAGTTAARLVHRLRAGGRPAGRRRRGRRGRWKPRLRGHRRRAVGADRARRHEGGAPAMSTPAGVVDGLLADRYRLTSRIAAGAVGEVWRARDVLLDRDVAVKTLRPEIADDDDARQSFRAEARSAGRLSSPAIAAVYDAGEDDGRAWLVMELVEGESLQALLRREGRLSPGRTLDVVAQAAVALQVAHDSGVVHRDVKPGNLLVRSDGVLKVTDFGIAAVAGAARLTRTGQVVGTAAYLSPEQADGREATPASDLYALGVVAYECLRGEVPFAFDNPVAVLLAHSRTAPPPLPDDVPPQLHELVADLLAKDPAQRPASAAEVVRRGAAVGQELGGVAAQVGSPTVPAPALPPLAPRPRSGPVPGREAGLAGRSGQRRAVRLIALLLALLAVALGVRGAADDDPATPARPAPTTPPGGAGQAAVPAPAGGAAPGREPAPPAQQDAPPAVQQQPITAPGNGKGGGGKVKGVGKGAGGKGGTAGNGKGKGKGKGGGNGGGKGAAG